MQQTLSGWRVTVVNFVSQIFCILIGLVILEVGMRRERAPILGALLGEVVVDLGLVLDLFTPLFSLISACKFSLAFAFGTGVRPRMLLSSGD